MGRYVPLISEATWQEICGLHRTVGSSNRAPFLPVGEPDFGTPGMFSVIFCGIAPGHVGGVASGYRERTAEIGAELSAQLNKRDGRSRSQTFWPEIARVRRVLMESGCANLRIGWANILPINTNDDTTAAAPADDLARKQVALAPMIWKDMTGFANADALVATFAEKWFDVHAVEGTGHGWSWTHADQMALYQSARDDKASLVWVVHAQGRRTANAPKAEDIAGALLAVQEEKMARFTIARTPRAP